CCQHGKEYRCVIDDGMTELVASVPEYDGVVLASPVYFFSMTSQAKAFLDRCYSLLKFTMHSVYFSHAVQIKADECFLGSRMVRKLPLKIFTCLDQIDSRPNQFPLVPAFPFAHPDRVLATCEDASCTVEVIGQNIFDRQEQKSPFFKGKCVQFTKIIYPCTGFRQF
ncbi:MAG: flavodoxin family protein, partial [Clostridia bacterium]|nr:flavodoxin family protein [Clostridia bacterium]